MHRDPRIISGESAAYYDFAGDGSNSKCLLPTPPTSLRFGHLPSKLRLEGRLGGTAHLSFMVVGLPVIIASPKGVAISWNRVHHCTMYQEIATSLRSSR